ncbi:hypothetical protein ATCC33389_0205080 [Aggregatibacter aphrophilus ATCC 33389]|nr:hypothetical protein ATCC33389_0205080 [Aggregatibacter aphrophilus ATCC 33389]
MFDLGQKTNCFDYRYLFGIGWIGGYAGHIKIKVTHCKPKKLRNITESIKNLFRYFFKEYKLRFNFEDINALINNLITLVWHLRLIKYRPKFIIQV